jgi:GNAT superfamily N-acetyltransferase
MSARFASERLGTLDRSSFSCGDLVLDIYFRQQAGQDEKRRLARTFVLRDLDHGLIAGFYTLSATSLLPAVLPPGLMRKLPRYDQIPGMLIGRLAVDTRYQGQGIGSLLILDAIARIDAIDAGVHVIVVDAYESAHAFYRKFGFAELPGDDRRMNLPMQTAVKALR